MKHLYVLMLLVVWCCGGMYQTADAQEIQKRNLVKINGLTLLGGKFSAEYERLLTDRIAVGAAVSFRPENGLPFGSQIRKWVDSDEVDRLLNNLTTSNFSITPEVRFYTSSRGAFGGFYVAPYVKFASYDLAVPYEFDLELEQHGQMLYDRTETIPLKGQIQSFTGGVSVGFNFRLSDRFYLDWRIIGPGYGSSKGDIAGNMVLNADEQAALREALRELEYELDDLPLSLKVEHEVNGDGASIRVVRSPWASIRSGLSVSYRF